MKTSAKTLRFILAGSILAAVHAHATPLYWDSNGTTTGAGTTPAGTWGVSNFFNDDSNGDAGTFSTTTTNADDVFFSAGTDSTGATLTISGDQVAKSITIEEGANTFSGGTSLTIDGTGGVGITINSTAGATTFSTPLIATNLQTWTNNSASLLTIGGAVTNTGGITLNGGTIRLNNQTNTGTGGLTLSSGKLVVGTSNLTNLIAGASSSVLTLSGGILTTSAAGGNGDRIFGNDLLINGAVQFNDGINTGHAYTFQGANQTFDGAVLSARDSNDVFFTTNPAVLAGNLTVNTPGGGTATKFTFSGGLTVSGGASANRTVSLNNGSTSVTISGVLAGTAAGQTITLAGTGTNNTIGLISGTGGNTPGLIVNADAAAVFKFTGASTFGGGVTVTSGIAEISLNTTGAVTNGPFGTAALTMNGGAIRPGTASDRSISNPLSVTGGNSTFASSTASGRALTFTGAVTVSGTPTLTFNNSTNTIFTGSTFTLNSDATFAGTGPYRMADGLTFSANRILTINSTGTGTFRGALDGGANPLTLSGNAFAGTGSNVIFGDGTAPVITGSTGGIIVNGPTVSFATTTSTFTGGVTATSGITRIGGGTTVTAGAFPSGPFGLGTFTMNGGTITGNSSTARLINNNIAITGDSTIGVMGDTTNTATLTFDPSTVTGGTFTLSGARTLTVNVGTTFTGPIVGSNSPSLAVKGIGTLTLTNAGLASTFGNVTIGDTVASGSLGGRALFSSQNAVGTGTVSVNYGGTFSTGLSGVGFSPTNVISVNNGGTYNPVSAGATLSAFAAGSSMASGATFTNSTSQVFNIVAANVSLPTAGALFINTNSGVTTIVGAYPTFTGTMAFGGSGVNTLTSGAATTPSGAQTLAFNQSGTGPFNFSGLTLGGTLTIAGTGNTGVSGLGIPQGSAGTLGNITQDASPRSITIAMAPIGIVSMTQTVAGFTGGLTINSGILSVDGGNTSANKVGGAFTLNGGFLRNTNGANNIATYTDTITLGANGGGLESFSTGNTQTAVFTGAITGSGPLTLRYGGQGTNSSSISLNPGVASTYAGPITVATSNGRGGVQFNANSLFATPTNGVTVNAGAVFGVSSYGVLTGNIAKFSTVSDSILALDNMPNAGEAINLSAGGLNKDIRLGNRNNSTYTGVLTPFSTTYNFTPGMSNTLTLSTANQLTSSNNLDVRAGAVSPGAYDVATGTLALTAANDYTGTTVVAGTVRNSLMGGGQTGTTLQLNSGSTLSGSTSFTVEKGSTLAVAGTNATITSTNPTFTVRGGSTFRIGSTTAADNNGLTDRVNDGAAITLGDSTTRNGGGTLTMAFGSAGAVSETLKSLTVELGENTVGTTNSAAGTLALTFNDAAASVYNRSAGGTVNISTTTGFLNFTNVPSTNVSGTGGAAILVGAFLGNAGYASATTTVGAPTYTVNNTAGTWAAGQNIDTTGAVSGTTTAASINSLRAVNGGTWVIGAGGLTVDSGMLMFAGNGAAISGGALTSGNGKDFIINMSGGNVSISAAITGGLPFSLVNSGGTGNLILTSASNAFTGINVSGNRFLIDNAGAWGNSGPINIVGGNPVISYRSATNKTLDSGYTIATGTAGGGSFMNGSTGTLTVQGTVTLNGGLTVGGISNGTTAGAGTLDFQGAVSGAGAIAVGFGTDRTRILFSNANNSGWTGGLSTSTSAGTGSGTANIFGFNANSFGTGPIVLSRAANLYFDTNAAGATTLSQAIAYNSNSVISFWGMGSGLSTSGGTAPLTIAGQVIGSSGLTFQGLATSNSQVSEIILKNTVSTSGTPTAYSFGTATSAQNFVNAQGGIQLGVTGFRGITSTSTALDRVEDGSGASSQVVNGALGFVRFSGAQSFIPGAVGPGFIAAIRKAASGNDARFGYLLTGTGGGTTYALPEGKSFIIGSLGSGAQVGGTLGVAGGGTATLLGGAKAAAGQLLSGFNGGDINIHANAAADTQSLNLLARSASDTLTLGSISSPVVFTPTYGDSGITSAITLLSKRTGATTLNKIGAGTVDLEEVAYTHTDGTSAAAAFAWNVTAGTLQAPDGLSLANSVTLSGASTLKASGAITYTNAVTVGTGGGIVDTNGNTVALGAVGGPGNMLTKIGNGTLDLNGAQTYATLKTQAGTTNINGSFTNGTVNANATTNFTVSQTLTALNIGTVALAAPSFTGGGAGAVVPEPGSLGLLLVGALGLAARRRRGA